MTTTRFTTAELRDHSSSISKSSRAARVAAAAARGGGGGMSSAKRSAAAKKGWETRRKNGFKAKGKESMADRAARGGPSVGDQMAAGPMEPMRNPKTGKKTVKQAARRSGVARAAKAKSGRNLSPQKHAELMETNRKRKLKTRLRLDSGHGEMARAGVGIKDIKGASDKLLREWGEDAERGPHKMSSRKGPDMAEEVSRVMILREMKKRGLKPIKRRPLPPLITSPKPPAAQEARKRRGSGAPASKKSALSAKDQSLPYTLKVKKLRTIGVRAQAKADWLSGRKGKDGKQLPAEFVDRAEAAKYQAKAKAVADELLALARENNDPRADRFK
jgi:hypothetical protein